MNKILHLPLMVAITVCLIPIGEQTAMAQFFKAEGKFYCMNYNGKLQIIAKIAPKQYEVQFVDPMTGEGRGHMILYTNKSEFDSDGLVGNDLWVKTTMSDGDETIKLPTKTGFDRKFQVIRESAACEAKSKKIKDPPLSGEDQEANQRNEEEAKQEARRNDQWKKWMALGPNGRIAACKKHGKNDRNCPGETWPPFVLK
jgi:hypothetical protein